MATFVVWFVSGLGQQVQSWEKPQSQLKVLLAKKKNLDSSKSKNIRNLSKNSI